MKTVTENRHSSRVGTWGGMVRALFVATWKAIDRRETCLCTPAADKKQKLHPSLNKQLFFRFFGFFTNTCALR